MFVAGGGYRLCCPHKRRSPITIAGMMELFQRGLKSNRCGGEYSNGQDRNSNKDTNNKQPSKGEDNDIELGRRRRLPFHASSDKKRQQVKVFGKATDSFTKSSTRYSIEGIQNKVDDARVCAKEKIQGLQYKMGDAKISAREKIDDRIEGVKGRVEEKIGGMRDKVEEKIEGVRGKVGDAKASARVKMEVMQEKVDDAAERGKQTLKTMWQRCGELFHITFIFLMLKCYALNLIIACPKLTHLSLLNNERYGMVALGTYFSLYIGVLGALFCIFDSGLLTAADLPTDMSQSIMGRVDGILSALPDWLENFLRSVFTKMQEEPRMQTLTVAWLATKLTEPVRLITTIFLTPRVARALGRAPKRPRKNI